MATINHDFSVKNNLQVLGGKIGANITQQHTIPAVTSDTFTLNAATQALTNKTYNGLTPTINAIGFTLAGGTSSRTLTVSANLTLTGTNGTSFTFPTTSATIARTDAAQTFTGTQTFSNDVTINGNLTLNGTSTTINTATLNVDDINIELGSVTTPTNATANGGGITLKGTTDKTIIWDSINANWTSSEDWNLPTGKVFKINNVSVLNSTTLGTGVTGSSLTSVGTITSGTWSGLFGAVSGANLTSLTAANLTGTIPSAVLGNSTVYIGTTAVALNRATSAQALSGISIDGTAGGLSATLATTSGGTGFSSYAVGDILFASTTSAFSKLADVATGNALISGGVGIAPSYGKIGLTTHITGTLAVANGGTGTTTSTGSGNVVLSTSPSLTTPNIGVASGTSFNSITALSAATPLIAGTGTVGVSTAVAREDHIHPSQLIVANIAGGLGGSIPYQTAANTTALLGNGAAGQVLQSNGTTLAPSWVTNGPNITSVGTITSGTWSGLFGAVSGANLTNLTAGNLTGTIPSGVLGASSVYIGTTAVALNRGTANLVLTGITSIDGYSGGLAGGNNTTLLGSIPYQSNTNVTTLLAPNTAATQKILAMTGTGTNGAAPVWIDLPSGATNLGYTPSTRILTSDTGTDVTLPLFSTANTDAGLIPGSNGNTTSFLRADGTWAPAVASWSIKTTTYTAVANDSLLANTNGGAFTITLPATPSANQLVRIADYYGTFVTNNLTIGRNGSLIMGLAEDLILNANNSSITLTYVDATRGWIIL